MPGIDEKPAALKKIGILGAGLMGGGIAMCFIQKGVPVVLKAGFSRVKKEPADVEINRIYIYSVYYIVYVYIFRVQHIHI